MRTLLTTLLLHESRHGQHFDWLIADPAHAAEPDGQLWAARVMHPWRDWSQLAMVRAEPLPPHRHRYLNYCGELSQGRGRVRVVSRGQVRVGLWSDTRMALRLEAPGVSLPLSIERYGACWRVCVNTAEC